MNGVTWRWVAGALFALILAALGGVIGHAWAKIERHEAAIMANATQIAVLQQHLAYLRISSDRQEANQEKLQEQLNELLRRLR